MADDKQAMGLPEFWGGYYSMLNPVVTYSSHCQSSMQFDQNTLS